MIFGKSYLELPGYDTQVPNMVYTRKGDSNQVLMLTRYTQASYAEVLDHLSKRAAAVVGLLPGIKQGYQPELSLLEKCILVQLSEMLTYKIATNDESVKYFVEASIPDDHQPGRNYIRILSGKIPTGMSVPIRMLDDSIPSFERYNDLIRLDWKVAIAVNRFKWLPSRRKVISMLKQRRTDPKVVLWDAEDYQMDEVVEKLNEFYGGNPNRHFFQKLEDKSDRALEQVALKTVDGLSESISRKPALQQKGITPLLHETLGGYQNLKTIH